jgi:hypothetical protein
MNRKLSMMAVALLATGIGVARAQNSAYNYFNHPSDPTMTERVREFALENKILQDESTSMPAESPQVDRSVPAADPEPRATTQSQEIARFRSMDRALQRESTSMPAESPRVDRHESAADPMPKASSPEQRKVNAAAEERFLEQNSTP